MSTDLLAARRGPTGGAGIVLMVLAMALVPMIDVQAKFLVVGGISAIQVVFLRMLCGTALMLPVMLAGGGGGWLRPPQGWARAFTLGFFSILTGVCFFGALEYLSIADTVAISFVQPLFVTLFSRLFLKETVGAARWIALLVGFGATLLIIRPGFGGLNIGSLLAFGSGAAMACYVIVIKQGTSGERRVPPLVLTFQTHFTSLVVAAPLMLLVWTGLSPAQWGMALAMTFFGLIGQYLIIKAYDHGDASLVAPFAYVEIITSTAVSWLFFAEVPDAVTFLGVGILICSSLYIAWRR